jgi:ribosomal protein L30E
MSEIKQFRVRSVFGRVAAGVNRVSSQLHYMISELSVIHIYSYNMNKLQHGSLVKSYKMGVIFIAQKLKHTI